MRTAVLIALMLALATLAVPGGVRAQEEGFGSSYLTPFPPGDIYNVVVVGDDLADGLHSGVLEAFQGDGRLQVRAKHAFINGLMRPDFAEKLVSFEEDLKREPASIAIVMLGAWDRVSARDANGKRMGVGTPGWRKEYGERAGRLMKALKRQKVGVYWVGLPNVARNDANEDAEMMNEILRERAYLNNIRFIDVFASFADEDGGYSQWGPDISGKIVRLRHGDGVYFTSAGNRKLAHFVERELKRDLTQARANRSVPLAGSEEEQARINPDKAKLAPVTAGGQKPGEEPGTPGAAQPAAAAGAAAVIDARGEQKADNGKISLRTITAGREEAVTLEIVRPAIPASVVALVTRRESPDRPSQMGATLIDQIAGGLTVMSSVTPSAAGGQGGAPKLSAAQTPYYRVLFKGERLAPKAGRADDVSWPRADAVQSVSEAAPSELRTGAPEETGSTPAAETDTRRAKREKSRKERELELR